MPALATYLPTSPSTAKSRTQRRRGDRGGSPIPRPVLFFLRTCADVVRFSVQIPPKPAGDLKIFRARAREQPRAARTTTTPPKCHKTAALGCRWPQNRGVPKNVVTFSRAPAYLPTRHAVSSRFFECPLCVPTIVAVVQVKARRQQQQRAGSSKCGALALTAVQARQAGI